MPYEHDLKKFKEQARNDAMAITMRNTADWLVKKIEEALIAAYVAGYKQCEQDYHDHTGL